ncbi:MAG TPA: tetratricopeptide repeat protein [Mucilaginibacter sp.]
MKEAWDLEDKQKYKEAITVLNETIDSYPKLIDAYLSRGADKSALNNYNGAISDYIQALKLNPKNTLALFNIGNNYKRLNNNLKAISYYNQAFATKGSDQIYSDMKPNSFVESSNFDVEGKAIFYERGLAYYKIDSLRKAFSDFRNCIISNYQVKESYYFLGIIHKAYKSKKKACECFLKSAQLGDKDSNIELKNYCK